MGETTTPGHKLRFVTAASLFDGHDAAINIIRRLLQAHGAEVIHLGHDRSVTEIVDAAIQEDADAVAVSSYQGGHMEFFSYMVELLRERGAARVKVFGGGGGVIVPEEIAELHRRGVARIFSPDDGRALGLDGMIQAMLDACVADQKPLVVDRGSWIGDDRSHSADRGHLAVARLITMAEQGRPAAAPLRPTTHDPRPTDPRARSPVVGITGTGGAGKSSLTDELVRRFLADFRDLTIAVLAVDPTKRRTGGALLGDRIRMNSLGSPRVYMRSLATRQAHRTLSASTKAAIDVCIAAGFGLVIVESAGAGQADSEIADLADLSVYVMTPEYGAAMQLEKIDMLDFADLVAINKFDRPGALDALRDVRKQLRRNRNEFNVPDEGLPVFPTCAHQFHDRGVNMLYLALVSHLEREVGAGWRLETTSAQPAGEPQRHPLIPGGRVGYLREIAAACRGAHERVEAQARVARTLYQLVGARAVLAGAGPGVRGQGSGDDESHEAMWRVFEEVAGGTAHAGGALAPLDEEIRRVASDLAPDTREQLATWAELRREYAADTFTYTVRRRKITVPLTSASLSGTHVPKVVLPDLADWGDIVLFLGAENVPGAYPYTAGVFPFKRTEELPTRMFAGEGGPERTNARFHYVSRGQSFARLSTAFDSVTLYGEDPEERPDIIGKVGESGVSICTVEDMERLYAGFDLCAPNTSVSMTINGPAPMILAMFFNVAGRQEAKRRLIADGRLAGTPEDALHPLAGGKRWDEIAPLLAPGEWEEALACAVAQARGTVQADILKEDQAQNTCIFSTEFALRMMGDIQQWFIANDVKNFYSVSISGYHIAEAGANPISQLAFTLANGFTYVEVYLARGMNVDEFAPNLSFFFSNGMDPEYTVIGRVARRIWARAMRERYGANERSQKLKYHIQTSGRSLHAQEIAFNDIRTTLQALLALADNCNSLHTNAYDEAITTPTEESVRRALAIQLINTREFGLLANENPLQGSAFAEWLTDEVERRVLDEFERLSERGGVLGAMETGYQRSRIQEESLHYEKLKHDGSYPIVGVNTFLDPHRGENVLEAAALTRSTPEEKQARIAHVRDFQERHRGSWIVDRGSSEAQPSGGRATTNDPQSTVSPAAPWEVPSAEALATLQATARSGGNLFAELLRTVCCCSLGQITHALYEVGGQYRRSM
ncbi:MAG TPA: methylmalonyl-CoA mutase family protein [Thermoanaerobaculaceae bacterium]|nr:methylmalonyl-CoA mutase family protein [Thermoanaerobaculaceae bacterium]